MKKFLLDTDILIHLFKKRFEIISKLDAVGIQNCYVSEITIAELLYGAFYGDRLEKHLNEASLVKEEFNILPISEALEIYASEKARLRKLGSPIDSNDLFIAATAVAHNLTLVSGNTGHMSRIAALNLEDWTQTQYNEFL